MNSIEEIRSTIATTLAGINSTYHPTIPVMWPNFVTIDIEHLTGPFLSIELGLANSIDLFGCGDTEIITKGEVMISYLRKTGDGLTGAAAYSDTLLSRLCYKELSGITYRGLKILSVSPYPGIVGSMNVIPFIV